MTVQEAIEKLKVRLAVCETTDSVLNIAIESMEKQIPKKVIFSDDGDSLLCPNCNFDLMGSMCEPDHDPYYCPECGQALDWEEGETSD